MKAALLTLIAGLTLSVSAQENEPPPSKPVLTYQEQPSFVEQAKATARKPSFRSRVTYSGPVAEVFGPKLPGSEVARSARPSLDDNSLDLMTQRPRGIVLFAINF